MTTFIVIALLVGGIIILLISETDRIKNDDGYEGDPWNPDEEDDR